MTSTSGRPGRRRPGLAAAVAVATSAAMTLGACGSDAAPREEAAAPTTSRPASDGAPAVAGGGTRTVSPYFFGMHTEQPFLQEWPTVRFKTVRVWGTYPDPTWRGTHTGPGQFDWTALDDYVENALAHGQDIVYVFGRVPAWASSEPGGACGPDPDGSCYPPAVSAWQEYVTAVTDRYRGRIAYWELWNEPDAESFWRGSDEQMVRLAQIAYPIITAAGGTVLSPSPQGRAGPDWTRGYLEAGGAPYADVNAFHSYLYAAPETLGGLVEDYRELYAEFGIEDRPLWDTEHSWGEPDSPFGGDPRSQAAWLARFQLLSFDEGIERSIWYGWEHTGWGTLFDKETQEITPAGIAYRQVHRWMVGATMKPCGHTGRTWTCRLSRPGGYRAVAAWSRRGQTWFRVPAGYDTYRTVTGRTLRVPEDRRVRLGAAPYLFVDRKR